MIPYIFKALFLLPFPPFLEETLLNLNLNIYSLGKFDRLKFHYWITHFG